MQNLEIEETKFTPKIQLLQNARLISFKGKSYPENTFAFYQPVIVWIKKYFENIKEETTVEFDVPYFNSSSSKLFFDIFDMLEEAVLDECNIVINWYYDKENEIAKEAGEDFKEDFETLKINLKKK